jgi:WD40 repeat protein
MNLKSFTNFLFLFLSTASETIVKEILLDIQDTAPIGSLCVSNNKLFSSTNVPIIREYFLNSQNMEYITYTGHQNFVTSLMVKGNYLYSSSDDSSIIKWDIKDHEKYAFHESIVTKYTASQSLPYNWMDMDVSKNQIFAGTDKFEIIMWNLQTAEVIRKFQGHQEYVAFVKTDGQFLYSGSGDKTIKKWDIETGACLQTYEGHNGVVSSIEFYEDQIISGSLDKTIKVWNKNSGALIKTITGHNDTVNMLHTYEGSLFSASDDTTIKQWRLSDYKLIASYDRHSLAVSVIEFDEDGYMYSVTTTTVTVFLNNSAPPHKIDYEDIKHIAVQDLPQEVAIVIGLVVFVIVLLSGCTIWQCCRKQRDMKKIPNDVELEHLEESFFPEKVLKSNKIKGGESSLVFDQDNN